MWFSGQLKCLGNFVREKWTNAYMTDRSSVLGDDEEERFELTATLIVAFTKEGASSLSQRFRRSGKDAADLAFQETLSGIIWRIDSPLPTTEDDANKHIQALLALFPKSQLDSTSLQAADTAVILTARSDGMMFMGRGADVAPNELAVLSELGIRLECRVVCTEGK